MLAASFMLSYLKSSDVNMIDAASRKFSVKLFCPKRLQIMDQEFPELQNIVPCELGSSFNNDSSGSEKLSFNSSSNIEYGDWKTSLIMCYKHLRPTGPAPTTRTLFLSFRLLPPYNLSAAFFSSILKISLYLKGNTS